MNEPFVTVPYIGHHRFTSQLLFRAAVELCSQKHVVEAKLSKADPPSVHEKRVGTLQAAIAAAQQDVERLKRETR